MFSWIKSVNAKKQLSDEKEINDLYKYWRIHIMLALYLGYSTYYLTRKSFNYVMPEMIKDLGLSLSDVGILSTAFYVVYGISRFASGVMSDAANPRYFMGIGLIVTGILNLIFGMSSSLWMFAMIWILNAFFQGWGWPPCSKSLTAWYSRNERGFWWSVCNTSHNVGGAIIPLLAGGLAVHFGWRYGMYIPGLIAIVMGIIVCWRLRDKPSTMGLPSVGTWRQDQSELQQEARSPQMGIWSILVTYIFTNKYIWLLAVSYVLVYIVRIGLNDWANLYLVREYGWDLIKANSALSFLEIGGFIGTLVAGWGSDYFFKGNRTPMNIIFMVGIGIAAAVLWKFPNMGYLVIASCFFLLGFFIFGPQMLIGMSAAEAAHKDSAGAATGFVGLFGYLGAALSGYPLARIIETAGWDGFFLTMVVATLASAVLLLPLLSNKNPSRAKQS